MNQGLLLYRAGLGRLVKRPRLLADVAHPLERLFCV